MRFIESRLFAAISFLSAAAQLLLVSPVPAATHPMYGGTLRVEVHAVGVSLDPREWQVGSLDSATNAKMAELVFERLVALDNYGRFQPVLATEWSHDVSNRRWRFTIRAGVRFSDGTALSAEDVVSALQPLLPATEQISASGSNAIVIQSSAAMPDLLEQLASGRYFVYRVRTDGALAGTGPFVLAEAPGGAGQSGAKNSVSPRAETTSGTAARGANGHFFFRANEEAWSGRPFVDGIDVALGIPPLRAMFDLQLGKADLIELSPELVPRARQANLRVWSSEPVTLYGLRFDDAQAASDVRLREALSLSLDRGTMANVLLQKQAEPAAALLPEWLSGYAFLFNVDTNLERAKELRRGLPANEAAGAEPLRLRVDPSGDLAKLLGERVAVNARQASILVQVIAHPPTRGGAASPSAAEPASGVHLFAWHYSSLSPRAELDSLFAAYNLNEPSELNATSTDQEQLYAREWRVLEERRVLPLIVQAESVGLGANVRDWMPARWGEWHLAEVWLESSEAGATDSLNKGNSGSPASLQPQAAASGAKP
jgi:peptide/nickel transport system substrate-binding protein